MPYAFYPDMLPKFFIDRDLGSKELPRILREAKLEIETSQGYYGIQGSQNIPDEEWIKMVAHNGWVAMSDDKFNQKPSERDVIIKYQARCFVIEDGTITAEEAANLILDNLVEIARMCAEMGPLLCILLINGGVERVI